jgi:hypothetical protein
MKYENNFLSLKGTLDYVGDRLVMIFRNHHMEEIYYSYSDDDGYNFTELDKIDSSLYSNNSGLGVTVVDNHIYLVFNDVKNKWYPYRHPLSLAILKFEKDKNINNIEKLKIVKRKDIF